MRILVLGGTSFVGRAIVEDARSAGHEVTLFSRGRTGADLFPELQRRQGDRDTGDYGSLAGGEWDAVVDVSAYVPRHVAQAAEALGSFTGRYLFISTCSVYATGDATASATDEDAPRVAPVRDTEEITGGSYGGLKVACEDDAEARYGDRLTVVRPGVVAGPHDPTDRFTYWVRRAARGGRVALPGDPRQPVQVVDADDLARLVTSLLETGATGAFNATGPASETTMAELVAACSEASGSTAEVVAVAPGAVDLPLLLTDRATYPAFRRGAVKARAAGLTATPLAATAAKVLRWDTERGMPPLAVDLTPEREAELLPG